MDTIRRSSMFIGGDWADADERFEIRSPATEELAASVAKGGREHADRAIAAAKAGPHALDEYTEEKFVHVDLSGRLDRRAYPLLLSTPPD
jgi:acyl-CoA reductase-like NAD-dependent aldehyde dehydrogenase